MFPSVFMLLGTLLGFFFFETCIEVVFFLRVYGNLLLGGGGEYQLPRGMVDLRED